MQKGRGRKKQRNVDNEDEGDTAPSGQDVTVTKVDKGDDIVGDTKGDVVVGTTSIAPDAEEPVAKKAKPAVEELKSLQRKIHRYVKQNKFTDNEIEYMDRLFEMDISYSPKHTSTSEMGIMRVLNNYSCETVKTVSDFIRECEMKWEKEREQKLFPSIAPVATPGGAVSAAPGKMATNAIAPKQTKKPKIMDNPLIQNAVDAPPPPAEEEEDIDGNNIQDASQEKGVQKKVEKHPLASQMKIIDSKKHPLSYYKGSLKRTMRVVRNIGALNAIEEYSKCRTSEQITAQHVVTNNAAEEEPNDEDENAENGEEVEEIENGEEEEYVSSEGFENINDNLHETAADAVSDDEEEESSDDDSDIVKDDMDDLYRRHHDEYEEDEDEEDFDEE